MALTLSLLKQRKDDSVKSATFFTALTDFSEQREFTPFLQNDFIDAIEDEINDKGILESFIMARTFSFLRANDLVYGPAVKSYMMGEAPLHLICYIGTAMGQVCRERWRSNICVACVRIINLPLVNLNCWGTR